MPGIANERGIIGIGCIVIPESVDREEYVKACYNREQFYVLSNDGELIPNVLVTKQILNDLVLPKTYKELGTQVLYVNLPKQNRPIIFATIDKKGVSEFRTEDDFLLNKAFDGGIVSQTVNTKSTSFVSAIKSYMQKAASYIIKVIGNEKSLFKVESSGWIVLQFEEGIKLRNQDKELRIYKDKLIFTDEYDNKVVIDKDKFMWKNADKKLRFMMDDSGYNFGTINFHEYFSKMWNYMLTQLQVQTAFGPSGMVTSTPIGDPQLRVLIEEFNRINDWPDTIH